MSSATGGIRRSRRSAGVGVCVQQPAIGGRRVIERRRERMFRGRREPLPAAGALAAAARRQVRWTVERATGPRNVPCRNRHGGSCADAGTLTSSDAAGVDHHEARAGGRARDQPLHRARPPVAIRDADPAKSCAASSGGADPNRTSSARRLTRRLIIWLPPSHQFAPGRGEAAEEAVVPHRFAGADEHSMAAGCPRGESETEE